MTLQRLPANAPLADLLEVLDTDGGLIVEGIFSRETIGRLRDDVLAAADQVEPGSATQGLDEDGKFFTGSNTIRFSSVGKISDAYFELLDNPVYAALADAVLWPNCVSYWINTGQVTAGAAPAGTSFL